MTERFSLRDDLPGTGEFESVVHTTYPMADCPGCDLLCGLVQGRLQCLRCARTFYPDGQGGWRLADVGRALASRA